MSGVPPCVVLKPKCRIVPSDNYYVVFLRRDGLASGGKGDPGGSFRCLLIPSTCCMDRRIARWGTKVLLPPVIVRSQRVLLASARVACATREVWARYVNGMVETAASVARSERFTRIFPENSNSSKCLDEIEFMHAPWAFWLSEHGAIHP